MIAFVEIVCFEVFGRLNHGYQLDHIRQAAGYQTPDYSHTSGCSPYTTGRLRTVLEQYIASVSNLWFSSCYITTTPGVLHQLEHHGIETTSIEALWTTGKVCFPGASVLKHKIASALGYLRADRIPIPLSHRGNNPGIEQARLGSCVRVNGHYLGCSIYTEGRPNR